MKQVITWSLILVVLFGVFIGLAFVALTYMTPSQEDIAKINAEESIASIVEGDSTETKVQKLTAADSLQQIVEKLTSDLFFVRVKADSLNQVLGNRETVEEQLLAQIEDLEKSNLSLREKNISVKELAKTYESMKVADIKPILEKVDDATIIALYKNMGSRTRKNLIQALSSVRAAQLTNKLVRTSS